MATPTLDRETILRAVRSWPAGEQIALAEEILELAQEPTVEEPLEPTPDGAGESSRQGSWQNLVGLLATDKPPPTDEEVAQWLDEHRMEKYGR